MSEETTRSFKNLSGNALEEAIVDEIAEQSRNNSQIHLRHLGISRVTRDMLKNISSIYSIDFQSNKITEIENGSFSSSEKLEKIDLMENHLTKITKHIFSGNFHELQEINLSFNAIDVIESGSFDRFVSLASIDISSNCIRHLHSDLFRKCPGLKRVDLSNNRITIIQEHLFKARVELNLLDLSHNKLAAMPTLRVKSIKRLDMSHNDIKKLNLSSHKEKKFLANVEELSVAHNSIVKSVEMSELRNDIRRLDISHNQINDLNNFPILTSLEVLKISHNNLAHLDVNHILKHFPSLKALNISGNKLDCSEYGKLHNSISKIVIFNNLNCSNITIDKEASVVDIIQSRNDEIVRQLQLNRNFLITLLSILVILMAFPIAFLLYSHLRHKTAVRYIKDASLIEQIEL